MFLIYGKPSLLHGLYKMSGVILSWGSKSADYRSHKWHWNSNHLGEKGLEKWIIFSCLKSWSFQIRREVLWQKKSEWPHILSLDISDTFHCLFFCFVNYSAKNFTPVNPSFILVQKKKSQAEFCSNMKFHFCRWSSFHWRQAISQLLVKATGTKIRSKGKNLENYLQWLNRNPSLKLAESWFKSYWNIRERQPSSWLKVQRWLRKTILEKRCQVIPLGRKYWIMFSPQRYTKLSVIQHKRKPLSEDLKEKFIISLRFDHSEWEFWGAYAIGTQGKSLKKGKLKILMRKRSRHLSAG